MDLTGIKNYYEHLVVDYLQTEIVPRYSKQPEDFFLDVACYALTKLPTRYIRHEIDLAFYMDEKEQATMAAEVKAATEDALKYIEKNLK